MYNVGLGEYTTCIYICMIMYICKCTCCSCEIYMCKYIVVHRHLKRTELQLRSVENSRDQQEKILEPYLIRQTEAIEAEKKRKEDIEVIRQEVEVLRRVVAQQVSH